jgi:N6-L-threonylcarbamoyladenine synthase
LRAAKEYKVKQVIAAGGVSANKGLRKSLEDTFSKEGIPFTVPPLFLCTDNAAMIAAAGSVMFEKGIISSMTMNGKPGMTLFDWN